MRRVAVFVLLALSTGCSVAGSARKSRATGEFIAAVPGFFVHGLGHVYADELGTGLILFSSELLAGSLIVGGTGRSLGHASTRMETVRISVGTALFFGGWLYDLLTTPRAVEEWNVAHGFGTARRSYRELLSIGIQSVPAPVKPAGADSSTGLVVAVGDFESAGVEPADAATLAEWLRVELVGIGGLRVVERAQMHTLLREQAFQQTGCTDQDCAVRLGRLLNAERIVVGTLGSFLGEYVLTVGVVEVGTGRIVGSDAARGRDAGELLTALKPMAGRIAASLR